MKSTAIILVLTSLLYSTTAALPNGQAFLATVSSPLPSLPVLPSHHINLTKTTPLTSSPLQFDTLPQVDSGGTAHVPTPYVNLGWNNFVVASPGNSILITPHSSPAGALGGLPDPTSNFTVDYPDSPIKAFDLISTWVACATTGNYPPEKCVVRFTGYKAHYHGSGPTGNVSHDYAFSGGDVMELVTLPESFRSLATLDVVITVNGSAHGQVVQLDDVKGVVYRW
ncbi:hypothetical protein G7Y79_00072g097800 [Physcia stellaris]|nr:hypothetical protein G7Y79_00072g097800 [Physcia stellaris]